MFPIADTTVLQKLLELGIMENPTEPTHTANRACLVAFTALITELHRLEPAFADADPDAYLQTALGLLPKLLMETPDMRTLETVVIIVSLDFTVFKSIKLIVLDDIHIPHWASSTSWYGAVDCRSNPLHPRRTQDETAR